MANCQFTIKATTKQELAQKIEKLFRWRTKKIALFYIQFTNCERIYYHHDNTNFCANFELSNYYYNKAKKLQLIEQ